MKRILFIIPLAFAVLLCSAQTTIDPLLSEEMNRRSDDEKIDIVVLMKAQYDRTLLNRQAAFCLTRAERRSFVVNELKSFAEASQSDLRHSLDEMEQHHLTTTPTMLWSANALVFSASKSVIEILSQRSDIELIGLDHKENLIPESAASIPSLTKRETTPNILQVNADRVWELGYTGQGVVVSVVDSGINYNHLDLADHLWDGGEAFPHHGYDVVNDDNDPMDDKGHGTHCAGTVLGDGTAGSLTGMAPEATLMCVKSIDAEGFGGSVNIAGGMEWSVEHGCDVISMSLGMVGAAITDKEVLRRSCVAINDAGIIAAVCAGNEGFSILMTAYPIPNNVRVPASCPPPYLDPDQMQNPGGLTCVMAIGAVDNNDMAADFTSKGPVTWQDTEFGDYPYNPGMGLIRPDVCAPGVNIKSLDYLSNDGYSSLSGTSQATPCVAGVIALMLSKNPELMPDEICRILEESSVKLTETKSNVTGVGRIDALAAIQQVPSWNSVIESNDCKAMVYPNPSRGQFTLKCEGMTEVTVFSVDGTMVETITANGECVIEGLRNGVYLLRINTIYGIIIQKIASIL